MIRKYDIADLDSCVDLYIDFIDAFSKDGDDAWNENELAERLKGILESPVFEGWVLEEEGKTVGFMLGVASYGTFGKSYDVLELFTAQGRNVQETAGQMIEEASAHLKSEGYDRLGCLSSELWTRDFFAKNEFKENDAVRFFERPL